MYDPLCSLIEFTDKQLCSRGQRSLRIRGTIQAYREDSRRAGTPLELDLYFTHEFHVTLLSSLP